jgi:5-methyltetrahydrofolate--homocysteine methyltransferase
MSNILVRMSEAVIEGDVDAVVGLTEQALDEGLSPQEILDNGLVSGMDHVGIEFKEGNMFIPEVLLSAKVMHASLDILEPLFAETGTRMVGRVIIGTTQGDLHDIGKNLVGMMMRGAGFEVFDLGTDVAADVFVETVRERTPDIVGISALLTTTMAGMRDTIEALQEAGLRDQVKVMVGGAPVTRDFAQKIGADGYAPDAPTAVDMAKEFVSA